MSDDRSLFLSDKTKLHWLPKTYKHYLNRTTIVYGRTNSGKSVIIEEIMKLCKDHIPTIFVISPTNSANNTYTNTVPPQCIKKELDAEWIERLLTVQRNKSELYINANKLENLKALFDKVADESAQIMERSTTQKAQNSIVYIEESNMEFSDKKTQKAQILSNRDEMLKKLYKTVIRHNKIALEKISNLNSAQKGTLEFLDLNPNVMFILDDCASTFKKLYKKTTAIKEIFYEGRWYHFTTIISAQDDKEIDSELRKNTTISIFTTAQSATSNFERSSNGYPKHEKLRAKTCTQAVFNQDDNDIKHYQKLVYLQGDSDPFRYTIADMYDDFRMGSDKLWELTDRFKEAKGRLKNNPIYEKYVK